MRDPAFYVGKPVRSLQTMLRNLSDLDDRILPVIPNGSYGANTYASVQSFQQAHGLPQTGIADGPTWHAVTTVHDQHLPQWGTPAVIPIWSLGQTIQPGQFNYHIYLIQAIFSALSHFFPAIQRAEVTGTLDSATEANLKWLQHASGLPETGALDSATWYYLSGLYRNMTGNGTRSMPDNG